MNFKLGSSNFNHTQLPLRSIYLFEALVTFPLRLMTFPRLSLHSTLSSLTSSEHCQPKISGPTEMWTCRRSQCNTFSNQLVTSTEYQFTILFSLASQNLTAPIKFSQRNGFVEDLECVGIPIERYFLKLETLHSPSRTDDP